MTEYEPTRTVTIIPLSEVAPTLRLNPPFFEDRFLAIRHRLEELNSSPIGTFVPDVLPDGSKGITYGAVGRRDLSPRGGVRYLQVINIRDTGIDFAIKPDRVAENKHNDPTRSRVRPRDILFTNNAFRDTETLLGRCVVVTRDFGKVNISQHIDRIRVVGINPFYVCCFLKCKYGSLQFQRVVHGVDSTGISFGLIKSILIPPLSDSQQAVIEAQYMEMAGFHDTAMTTKEQLLEESAIAPGQYGQAINALAEQEPRYVDALREAKQRLEHLLAQIVAIIEGKQAALLPFPGATRAG